MRYLVFLLLTGCANVDLEEMNRNVNTALEASARAELLATEAVHVSNQALATSNDAVEAVSRMAEKCCRK